MDYLLQNCKIVQAVAPTAGSVADLTATEVDGRGYSKALFVFNVGAAGTLATYDVKIQKAAATGMGSAADVTGAALTQVLAATGAAKVYAIEVTIDPAKPFMIAVGAVATQTFANGAICILHNGSGTYPKSAPATQAILA